MKKNNIVDNVRKIREAKKLSQSELARNMGWPVTKLSKIENGQQGFQVDELIKLADCLEVSIEDICGKSVYNPPKDVRNNELGTKFAEIPASILAVRESDSKASWSRDLITKTIPELIASTCNINQKIYKIDGSIGKGNFAEIPWIALFDTRITVSAQRGVYLVYLIRADLKGMYLSLNQGFTYFKDRFKGKKPKNEIGKMSKKIRDLLPASNNFSTEKIDLFAKGDLGKGYMAGHILGKYYDFSNIPDDNTLVTDLLEGMELYQLLSTKIGKRSTEQFYDYFVSLEQGFILDNREISSDMIHEPSIEDDSLYSKKNYEDKPEDKKDPVFDKEGKKRYKRNLGAVKTAFEAAEYRCELCHEERSFISKSTGKPYYESHHFVPMHFYEEFDKSIDVPANLICLCAQDHRLIHHGRDEDRLAALEAIYNLRAERLRKAGIDVSFDDIKKFYNITNNTEKRRINHG